MKIECKINVDNLYGTCNLSVKISFFFSRVYDVKYFRMHRPAHLYLFHSFKFVFSFVDMTLGEFVLIF